ncbi:hypothetical protein B0675_02190 [Streptomyces sp. M41(2017)]|uniref:nuclease-related domain-containing protein n=1 Tax=Streptomyces sp. M41(2017) TaxID=1955065 RepID=UPI0009C0A151|nr:nuclease-related domain-containing protein [Streptomyces sp. M41(2017)]OQQ16117.1 hypothetical protein B0675_02190 [Streptomyces sp. M41(2017)]
MTGLVHTLLLAALLAFLASRLGVWVRIRSWLRTRHTGAGASAAARARQLRTPAVRIAGLLNIPTQRGRQAQRWEAGAAGERRTAERLRTLEREGWTVLHDRALPRSRANLDHLVISPTGRVYLPDTKRYSSQWPLTVANGRLYHGDRDVTQRLDGLYYETRETASILGVPVMPLVVMDGPPMPENGLSLDGLRIIPAHRLREELRAVDRACSLPHRSPSALAHTARRELPAYTQGARR